MIKRKSLILEQLKNCPSIVEVFGISFLEEAINTYQVVNEIEWSRQNCLISNYFMSVSYYQGELNFITELERMLTYFLSTHRDYITSTGVLTRLTSKDEHLFQGKWSELVLAYYLVQKGIQLIDLSRTQLTDKGEVELFDLSTDQGEVEVTVIMSEKGRAFDTADVFGGSLQLGEIERHLIDRKISSKSGKKILAIDCTFVDEVYRALLDATLGIQLRVGTFKQSSKIVYLFLRSPATQQVGLLKELNLARRHPHID